jgi:enoyl-CoA hydratase/carnithine racemase
MPEQRILGRDERGAIRLERRGAVFVLRMERGENRFDRLALDALGSALDEVERTRGPAAVVCIGAGRFFSNGYDLEALARLDRAGRRAFIRDHQALLARWLRLPRPTVAALNGHAVGAGALFALASDWRFMRRDRGVFWLPEIDAGIPFRKGMRALLRHRLTPPTLRDAALTGRRFGGDEALVAGIVHEVTSDRELLPRALARAAELAPKPPAALAALRASLLGEVTNALDPSNAAPR